VTAIYVGGGACPVREAVFRLADRPGLAVFVVSNGSRPIRPSGRPNVRIITVPAGPDAADDWIADRITPADVCVTADIPLGARCLGIHFEGPFLHPKFRRVHRNEWLLTATRERSAQMHDACRGALLMVTMAPEVDGVADAARR